MNPAVGKRKGVGLLSVTVPAPALLTQNVGMSASLWLKRMILREQENSFLLNLDLSYRRY